MKNLLKPGALTKTGKGLELSLYLLSGKSRPDINNIETYRWNIFVRGTNRYTHIDELRVDLSFATLPSELDSTHIGLDSTHIEVIDYIPKREREDVAIVELTAPQLVKVSIPITSEKIKTERHPLKVEWIFKNINLKDSENMVMVIEGAVNVRFFPKSAYRKILISMNVIPEFSGKKLVFLKNVCHSSPRIDAKEILECSDCIIPGGPNIGHAHDDQPDSKRTFTYNYIESEGILEKGTGEDSVRNVSLRAETLCILFNQLRCDLDPTIFSSTIKAAGRNVGKDFSEELERILGHKPTFKEWFDYDSSAGLGLFEINDKKNRITVKNSFSAFHIHDSNIPVCCFLEGYFEGILATILRRDSVRVNEVSCEAQGSKLCTFNIE